MPRPKDVTAAKDVVLTALARHGNIERASRAAKITSQTFRRWRAGSSSFDRAVKQAIKAGQA